jgi:hypothetical protein
MANNWTDIDVQGRRMNRIVKLCETEMNKQLKGGDNDLALAYIDRLIKASNHQAQLTDMTLNLKLLRKLAEKKYLDVITEDKLKQLK